MPQKFDEVRSPDVGPSNHMRLLVQKAAELHRSSYDLVHKQDFRLRLHKGYIKGKLMDYMNNAGYIRFLVVDWNK